MMFGNSGLSEDVFWAGMLVSMEVEISDKTQGEQFKIQ